MIRRLPVFNRSIFGTRTNVLVLLGLLFAIVCTSMPLDAQMGKPFRDFRLADFREVEITQAKDTVIRYRKMGSIWFGPQVASARNFFLGTLNVPRIQNDDSRGTIVTNNGVGNGTALGLVGEWLPLDQDWGMVLRLNLFDQRGNRAEGNPLNTDTSLRFFSEPSFTYISVSPQIRFNVLTEGLHLIAGADVDFLRSSELRVAKEFKNSGDIEHNYSTVPNFAGDGIRYGVNVGVGYDLLSAIVGPNMRLRISPWVSMHAGSNFVSSYLNSSLNSIFVRMGLAIKLGVDERKETILPFDSSFVRPPIMIARVREDRGISSPLIQSGGRLAVNALTLNPDVLVGTTNNLAKSEEVVGITIPQPGNDLDSKIGQTSTGTLAAGQGNGVGTIASSSQPQLKPDTIAVANPEVEAVRNATQDLEGKPKVTPSRSIAFSYPTSSSTVPTKEIQLYLDQVADFLKDNPRATVRIVGHSDNSGTPLEQQQYSEVRSLQVINYLMRKGIPRGRLLGRAVGAREAVASNFTADGRQRNRRVEIVIVP